MKNLTGNRVRCSSPRYPQNSNLAAEVFGDARILVRRCRSIRTGSGLVRRARRIATDTLCSRPTVCYSVPGRIVPCGCVPRSCSPICTAGRTTGNADARDRTQWDCRLRTPKTLLHIINYTDKLDSASFRIRWSSLRLLISFGIEEKYSKQ